MTIPRLSLSLDFSMHVSILVLAIFLVTISLSSSTPDKNIDMDSSGENTDVTDDITDTTTNVIESSEVKIWPDLTVYVSISSIFTPFHIYKINRVITFIEENTCIKFRKPSKEQEEKYYLFISGEGEQCSSELGWTNKRRQLLVLKMGFIMEGCFIYEKLLELMLRTLGFEGLIPYDHKIWRSQLGLRKKHLKRLNEMYHCYGSQNGK